MENLLEIMDHSLALAGYEILEIGEAWIEVRSVETGIAFHIEATKLIG